MKKVIAGCLVCLFVLSAVAVPPVQAEKDAGAAAILSAVMPGVGEWYNNDWDGSFPFGECVVGYICFLFQLSSIMDAANGNTDAGLRFDFWSAPQM